MILLSRRFLESVFLSQQFVALSIQGVKVGVMALYLVLSTRSLGLESYGYIIVAVSVASLFVPFVGFGAGVASVRDAARNSSCFSSAWGLAIARYVLSSLLLGTIYIVLGTFFVDEKISPISWALVAISEIILLPVCMLIAYAFMAYGLVRTSLLIQLANPVMKLLALLLVASFVDVEIDVYTISMVAGSFVSVICCAVLARMYLPPAVLPSFSDIWKVRGDILYSVNSLTNQGVMEVSKPVTMAVSGAGDAGLYGASLRIVSAATMPVTSVIQSQAFRLFGYGNTINIDHIRFLVRYIFVFLLYAVFATFFFWMLSDLWGRLLGAEFESVGNLVVMLALWLPIFATRQVIGAVFTTTDRMKERIALDIAAGIVFLFLAFNLISVYGAVGTVIAFICSEAGWVLMSVAVFWRLRR